MNKIITVTYYTLCYLYMTWRKIYRHMKNYKTQHVQSESYSKSKSFMNSVFVADILYCASTNVS